MTYISDVNLSSFTNCRIFTWRSKSNLCSISGSSPELLRALKGVINSSCKTVFSLNDWFYHFLRSRRMIFSLWPNERLLPKNWLGLNSISLGWPLKFWEGNTAQLALKKTFAVNCVWPLYLETTALWTLMTSPILWLIGKSSNLFANRTKV